MLISIINKVIQLIARFKTDKLELEQALAAALASGVADKETIAAQNAKVAELEDQAAALAAEELKEDATEAEAIALLDRVLNDEPTAQ